MEGSKLEASAKQNSEVPASYKVIPEIDMEEEAASRAKTLAKVKSAEIDGADEKMLPKEESLNLKVINEKQNGDAKLDIGEIKSAFVGLTKEELMKYANDPFWVRLRWFLFITFWLLWGLMLVGAVLIICAAPKCDPPSPRTWWQKGPLVEPAADRDVDEVKRLKERGVAGVVLRWSDDAYVDFNETHAFVGGLKKYADEGVKVIVELRPGTSRSWFEKSENGVAEFGDYYIWRKGKMNSEGEDQPPNNWRNINNTHSWIYSEKRGEYYYAPGGGLRPHLNFRNRDVVAKFSAVLKKFLGHGVDGVRLEGVPSLLVSANFEDEEVKRQKTASVLTDYSFYTHTKTTNLLDLGPLLKEWRDVVKNLTGGPFMVAEELSNIEAYKVNGTFVVDLPVQSRVFAKPHLNVTDVVNVLNSTFKADDVEWPSWKVNSSDMLDAVVYLLPGTPLLSNESDISEPLLKIRESPSVMRGICDLYSLNNGSVFAFIRLTSGNPGILVALNPTDTPSVVDFPAAIKAVSEDVTVLFRSNTYNESFVPVNVKQNAHDIPLLAKSAIVLSYVPPKND